MPTRRISSRISPRVRSRSVGSRLESGSSSSSTRGSGASARASATRCCCPPENWSRSEEHTSELQSRLHLVCRLLLEKKKKKKQVSSNTQKIKKKLQYKSY